ncbi:sigma-70 family RNA polymerase sigma factor [Marilutibacter spongiae]|uniref:Sigma-70 family RNA polymerase sigma factor n=1 Tax=Marilutibacter spongiae TaxID=2025720 RepID=A0A7W3TKP2_9GAMM|nr:sigma-70 family RNA polymerase sigma factor [Lysobacter spongiae]MBB1060138.1 sigma-70 family RNA polymerase sigma factor [Lysobacter spongiae]
MASPSARPEPDAERLRALLARVAEGDALAFDALYRDASPRLMGVCLHLLADRAEAEDVLQDVFVTVWNKAAQFDPRKAGAMTWMATVARNRSIDRLRARPAAQRLAPIDLAEALADEGPTPAASAASAQDGRRLDACIDELEPRRQRLVRIAFFEGATYEELSQRVGSPLGSIKSWIRRSLQQLRACLER